MPLLLLGLAITGKMGNEVLIKSQDSVLLKSIIMVMMMMHVGDDGEDDDWCRNCQTKPHNVVIQ